jgi:hypothetical protein
MGHLLTQYRVIGEVMTSPGLPHTPCSTNLLHLPRYPQDHINYYISPTPHSRKPSKDPALDTIQAQLRSVVVYLNFHMARTLFETFVVKIAWKIRDARLSPEKRELMQKAEKDRVEAAKRNAVELRLDERERMKNEAGVKARA